MLLLPSIVSLALVCAFAAPTAFGQERAAHEAGGAPARSEPAAPSGYEAAIELAIHEFELRNYAEARARFLEAHKLFPNARTFRALGMVEYELKNYGDAIEALESALRSQTRPLTGALRSDAEALLERAKGYVGRIRLELKPDATSVAVDGVPIQLGLDGVLVLDVGDHGLEFRAPGRLMERRAVKITGGEEKLLRVVLPPAATHTDGAQAERRPLHKNPWLWTAVGAVAVGTAVGLGVSLSDPGGGGSGLQGGSSGVSLPGPTQ
ncbi:MAG TPA: tetratricopeptide repeat protein [Polyangiales bacterium]